MPSGLTLFKLIETISFYVKFSRNYKKNFFDFKFKASKKNIFKKSNCLVTIKIVGQFL